MRLAHQLTVLNSLKLIWVTTSRTAGWLIRLHIVRRLLLRMMRLLTIKTASSHAHAWRLYIFRILLFIERNGLSFLHLVAGVIFKSPLINLRRCLLHWSIPAGGYD